MTTTDHRSGDRLADLVVSARGVVFDKDGTLVDLDARWTPYFRSFIEGVAAQRSGVLVSALMARLGVAGECLVPDGPAAVATIDHIKELVVAELVGRDYDHAEARDAAAHGERLARFGPLTPLGDVAASLAELKRSGRRIGVATSDERTNTVAELDELGVTAFVDAVRCGDDDAAKPNPAVLLGIAAEWDVEPKELLFVGDSRQDLETARSADVAFIAISDPARASAWIGAGSAACIATIDELASRLS